MFDERFQALDRRNEARHAELMRMVMEILAKPHSELPKLQTVFGSSKKLRTVW